MRRLLLKNERGFTFTEVLFAFLLLGFVVVSSAGLLGKASQMAEDNQQRLLALQTVQSVLDAIKDTPLTSLGAINTTALIPANLNQGAVSIQSNPATITATTTIATITVTVSWRGASNRTQQLQMSTMRSRY